MQERVFRFSLDGEDVKISHVVFQDKGTTPARSGPQMGACTAINIETGALRQIDNDEAMSIMLSICGPEWWNGMLERT